MKQLHVVLILLLALCLLLPSAASADLRRGDKGEDVYRLQTALRDSGFLGDEPDGIFGKRTEQAVLAFQAFYGYTTDGVVDETQLAHLLSASGGLSGAFFTDGAGADGRGVESYCYAETRSDGFSYKTNTVYCEEHARIASSAEASLLKGKAEESVVLYEEALMRLYSKLWEQLPEEDAGDFVKSAVASNNLMISAHMELLEKRYGCSDTQFLQAKHAELLRAQMVFLCGIVNAED